MKLSRKAAIRAVALVAAGGAVLGISQAATAATPPYEPDSTNQIGQILFYNAAGNLVTSGNINDDPNFKYAVATSDDPIAANTSATLYAYTPVNGQPPGNWTGEQLSGTTTFPVASPANVAAAGAHRPVVTQSTTALGALNLASYIADVPNTDTTTSYAGLYQLRIQTAGNTKYWAADISVNPSTGVWTLLYNTPAATTTALTASPVSPQTAPASAVTLTATVTANAPGAVTFTDTDTSTQVGATQTLPASATNTASVTIPAGLAVGTHHYAANYTPTVGALFAASTGSLAYVVQNAPADNTATSLSVTPGAGTVGDSFTFSSDVTDTTAGHTSTIPQGTVQFFSDGTSLGAVGSQHTNAAGHAQVTGVFGLTAGTHQISATFTPDNSTQFNSSSSANVPLTVAPGANDPCNNLPTTPGDDTTRPIWPIVHDTRDNICSDDQTFQVTVPRGNLFISTPYTPLSPFDLHTMTLDPTGLFLHASAPFGTATHASPGSQGVTIIDTRSSNEGWTASVTSSNFTKTTASTGTGDTTINACNLGFINVAPDYVTGNAIGASKPIAVNDVPNGGSAAIAPAGSTSCSTGLRAGPHQFATIASNGTGSVNVVGTMDLYAPTSVQAGLYQATVTFSIVSVP